ncbi:MAG: T9SS C-terminal target domain-containing protein [Chitinophagia bacterium]|nr:T9SS C-terminal target domain-containing protein [Chitinophagia bacterium]
MYKLLFTLAAFCLLSPAAFAQNKIKYYFNHNVDNSVSTGVNAINLNGRIDDTLAAYISRAKYTIDVAVYNFTSTTSASLTTVINAINSAQARGVKVRWIKDGSSTNSGVASLASAIPVLASPTSSSFTIMHNKFMIIDAKSSDPNDAVVWTGSTNWSVAQFNTDYDNVVIVQDSALAHAYTNQFNMMWGDTGMAYNTANAKFGHLKTDQGAHNFIIDGHRVELYFSPADNTNAKIVNAINSAKTDLYFGMYTFTYSTNATAILNRRSAGVYVAGIVDNYSDYASNSAFTALQSGLPASQFKVYYGTGIYHNKYLIVDPSDTCSDPLVLTGSHNWSLSANTDNDENTLIIHDATAANIYYQSFKADFNYFSGTLPVLTGCTLGINPLSLNADIFNVYPNPSSTGIISLSFAPNAMINTIEVYNTLGIKVFTTPVTPNQSNISLPELPKGIYYLKAVSNQPSEGRTVVIE